MLDDYFEDDVYEEDTIPHFGMRDLETKKMAFRWFVLHAVAGVAIVAACLAMVLVDDVSRTDGVVLFFCGFMTCENARWAFESWVDWRRVV